MKLPSASICCRKIIGTERKRECYKSSNNVKLNLNRIVSSIWYKQKGRGKIHRDIRVLGKLQWKCSLVKSAAFLRIGGDAQRVVHQNNSGAQCRSSGPAWGGESFSGLFLPKSDVSEVFIHVGMGRAVLSGLFSFQIKKMSQMCFGGEVAVWLLCDSYKDCIVYSSLKWVKLHKPLPITKLSFSNYPWTMP